MARIIVVDDDASIRDLILVLLSIEGHHVTAVPDGREALARLEAEPFDLMLLDVTMPGMCGYELLDLLGKMPERAHIPVALISGRDDGDRRDGAGAARERLGKPFDPQALIDLVRSIVERNEAPAPRTDLVGTRTDQTQDRPFGP